MKIEVDLTRVYVDPIPEESITKEMVEELVSNYNPNFRQAPVTFGHPSLEEQVALGFVESVSMDGDILKGVLNLNKEGSRLINEGLVIQGSISFQKGMTDIDGNLLGENGFYILHHALLGSSNPAVADLKKLQEGVIYAKSLNIERVKNGILKSKYSLKAVQEVKMDAEEIKSLVSDVVNESLKSFKKDIDDDWEEKKKSFQKDLESDEENKTKSGEEDEDTSNKDLSDEEDIEDILDIVDKAEDMGIDAKSLKTKNNILKAMSKKSKIKGSLYNKAMDGYFLYKKQEAQKEKDKHVKSMSSIEKEASDVFNKNKDKTTLFYKSKFKE